MQNRAIKNAIEATVLFAKEMDNHSSAVGRPAMLPNVNTLPCPENEFPTRDRDAEVDCGQRSADVRGHVVVTLGRVDEHLVAVGDKLLKKGFEVAAYVRIGILLNEQRRGSVLQVECRETRLQTAFRDKFFNTPRELVEAASASRNIQFVNTLSQHDNACRARTFPCRARQLYGMAGDFFSFSIRSNSWLRAYPPAIAF